MLISNVLKKMDISDYEILNEQHVDTLALVASNCEETCCVFCDDERYVNDVKENVKMVVTTKKISDSLLQKNIGVCIVEEPRILFFMMHNYLCKSQEYAREKYKTTIGNSCQISPLAVIDSENVTIGSNVVIEEFAVIRANTVIGDNCIIRAGSKIGGQGFEFKRKDGMIMAVEHCGGVIIENDVEIQYNSCVDRAIYPWDNTKIGAYTKIDNLVHIGHAVKIEKNVMVVANTGIGGRVEIGQDCWIGFGATIRNGIKIGEGARANMGAVVTRDIVDFQSVTGNFAIDHASFIRNMKNISSN